MKILSYPAATLSGGRGTHLILRGTSLALIIIGHLFSLTNTGDVTHIACLPTKGESQKWQPAQSLCAVRARRVEGTVSQGVIPAGPHTYGNFLLLPLIQSSP